MAVKNANVRWLLNFRIYLFLKGVVTKMSKKKAPSKQNVRAACPKDKLEFKIFWNPVFYN